MLLSFLVFFLVIFLSVFMGIRVCRFIYRRFRGLRRVSTNDQPVKTMARPLESQTIKLTNFADPVDYSQFDIPTFMRQHKDHS